MIEAVNATFFRQAGMRLDEKGLHLDGFRTRQWVGRKPFGKSGIGWTVLTWHMNGGCWDDRVRPCEQTIQAVDQC